VISDDLLRIVHYPDCDSSLTGSRAVLSCQSCGRDFASPDGTYLSLNSVDRFSETTKFVDEAFHLDGTDEMVSPALLTAGVKNAMLRRYLDMGPSDRVLDLGCGNGRFLVWALDSGAHLLGIDAAPYFSAEARTRVDLITGDLRKLPLVDGAVTKAYSLDVCEHLSLEGLSLMLRETGRALAPGGALILYTHVRKNSWIAFGPIILHKLAFGLDRIGILDLSKERLRKSDHLNPLATLDDLHQVAAKAGFRVDTLRYYTPLFGGLFENLLVPLVEQALRTVARRRAKSADAGTARATRLSVKRRIATAGPTFVILSWLNRLSMLDIFLFGKAKTGFFFALLRKK
jgi:SAM-dependent methyltransferase